MKETIKLTLKGFLIGLSNIIPGISGGSMALSLGIYEKFINSINNFFKNINKNLMFLLPILIGDIASTLAFSKLINYTLNKYEILTIMFFMGIVLSSLPMLINKVSKKKFNSKNVLYMVIPFILIILFSFLESGSNVSFDNMGFSSYLLLFVVGLFASMIMVIPGISGSFFLLVIGYYEAIIKVLSDVTNFENLGFNLSIIIPIGLGVLIGIVSISKIMKKLITKYKEKFYFISIGFILGSILLIIIPLLSKSMTIGQLLIGFGLMILSFLLAYRLGEK